MHYSIPDSTQEKQIQNLNLFVAKKLRNSMAWMVVGLFTTVLTVLGVLTNGAWLRFAFEHSTMFLFAELAVVFLFSARAYSASPMALKAMFLIYSILNGFTMTIIALAYNITVIGYALVGTLAFFISCALIGLFTKRDLSSLSSYLFAALIAMILTSIAMFFMGNTSTISLVLGYVGVVVFALFTAVDINRIKQNIIAAAYADESVLDRIELIGALSLYLDFVNLFLSFLRIFGNRR